MGLSCPLFHIIVFTCIKKIDFEIKTESKLHTEHDIKIKL